VLAKILVVLAVLGILYALGSAFFFMLRDKGQGQRTLRRLTWRVVLSLLLLVAIMLAMKMGWLEPGSPGPVRYPTPSGAGPG
jgi:cytochrome bd-type quinol oxidase subunit 2